MAKAAAKPITWLSLEKAREQIGRVYLSPKYAGSWIVERLVAKKLRWRSKAVSPPDTPVDGFWQSSVRVDWHENTATKPVVLDTAAGMGFGDIALVGVEVAQEDLPAEPAPARDRGGRREIWNWKDLAAELPDIVKKKPFEDRQAFEEWLQINAQRLDGKPRKADPEINTVRRAIRRHHLDEIPGLFKSA